MEVTQLEVSTMRQPQVMEGTWDEVSAQLSDRAEELRSYGKLRLIVLREDVPQQDYEAALAELFEAADKLEAEPGKPPTDPHEANVMQMIAEKFRQQGLKV